MGLSVKPGDWRLVRKGSGQKSFAIPAAGGWEAFKDQVSDYLT